MCWRIKWLHQTCACDSKGLRIDLAASGRQQCDSTTGFSCCMSDSVERGNTDTLTFECRREGFHSRQADAQCCEAARPRRHRKIIYLAQLQPCFIERALDLIQ